MKDVWTGNRQDMVERQLRRRGIKDERVLQALRTVPRHEFVPQDLQPKSYADEALQLGPGQSISQPYIVALMTELARPLASDRALEIGTGSGYQAAVLAELVESVCTVERDPLLAELAQERLARLCYRNVRVRCGDGADGWPERAPFDVILVTAGCDRVPPSLLEQLAAGGRLVVPVGSPQGDQILRLIERDAGGRFTEQDVQRVRFVRFLSGSG
jgi:protein-L-isoaspartate(D-aspartate) O-methyltransferase